MPNLCPNDRPFEVGYLHSSTSKRNSTRYMLFVRCSRGFCTPVKVPTQSRHSIQEGQLTGVGGISCFGFVCSVFLRSCAKNGTNKPLMQMTQYHYLRFLIIPGTIPSRRRNCFPSPSQPSRRPLLPSRAPVPRINRVVLETL